MACILFSSTSLAKFCSFSASLKFSQSKEFLGNVEVVASWGREKEVLAGASIGSVYCRWASNRAIFFYWMTTMSGAVGATNQGVSQERFKDPLVCACHWTEISGQTCLSQELYVGSRNKTHFRGQIWPACNQSITAMSSIYTWQHLLGRLSIYGFAHILMILNLNN